MSRMDVLSEEELKKVISNSTLTYKYNATIDRESAYELLQYKIASIHKEQQEAAIKQANITHRTSPSSKRSTRQNPLIKVVTSATFIRAVFGILKKIIK